MVATNMFTTPKSVLPRNIDQHGFLGIAAVRRHGMLDSKFDITSMGEQFKKMTLMLKKYVNYQNLEAKNASVLLSKNYRLLKKECRYGRLKLKAILHDDIALSMHNIFQNHKDLQRRYKNLPAQMVEQKMDEKTFSMRKERDRLTHYVNKLNKNLKNILLEKGQLEDRVKYENMFVLQEEKSIFNLRKRVTNAEVRVMGVMAINSAYKEMLKMLEHEGKFYEPILCSLNGDVAEQENFIKYVIYLCLPAIDRCVQLGKEFGSRESQIKQLMQEARNSLSICMEFTAQAERDMKASAHPPTYLDKKLLNRYLRETPSMLNLQKQTKNLEKTIKELKTVTLSAMASELTHRLKRSIISNKDMQRHVTQQYDSFLYLNMKKKYGNVFKSLRQHSENEECERRSKIIQQLQKQIEIADKEQALILKQIKDKGKYYKFLIKAFWNMQSTLYHVGDYRRKMVAPVFKTSYLHLPLLKFNTMDSAVSSPIVPNDILEDLLNEIKHKVELLAKHSKNIPNSLLRKHVKRHHSMFVDGMHQYITEMHDFIDATEPTQLADGKEDLLEQMRLYAHIATNQQIKQASAKIVEENRRKDEE